MKGKRLMLLGGLRYLLPVIREAHRLGCHVITCDYLPHNIAHRYSDEYINLSILNREAVLRAARELRIDGIMSFAVDPGVVTAAYVAEQMGLPFQGSYRAVSILQDKARFRRFLADNGFNCPTARGFSSKDEAIRQAGIFNWPVIVKPTDSAGSKGVSRVDHIKALPTAIDYALSESHSGEFIIEDFLEKDGPSSDSDCFTVDGRLVYCSFSDQLFDQNAANAYAPAAYCWPASGQQYARDVLQTELQRLADLLGLRTGIYNIETRLATDGRPYIMEVSPRGGGNRLSEMLNYATGTNLVELAVLAALGMELPPIEQPVYRGFTAELILHADRQGTFRRIEIARAVQPYLIETDLWVEPGEAVDGFTGANKAIGTLALRFPSRRLMENAMSRPETIYKVITD